MADKKKDISTDDIDREAAALRVLAEQFQDPENTRDPEQLNMLIDLTSESAANLEEMAMEFEAQELERLDAERPEAEGPSPNVVVVLTPEQRVKVKEETGLDMETVVIEDADGLRAMTMPETTPPEIEAIAIAAAIKFKAMLDAHEAAAENLDQAIADIEENASPEMLELLDQVLEDPKVKEALGIQDEAEPKE